MTQPINLKTGECNCQKTDCLYNWISRKLKRKKVPPKECPRCKRYDWRKRDQ